MNTFKNEIYLWIYLFEDENISRKAHTLFANVTECFSTIFELGVIC